MNRAKILITGDTHLGGGRVKDLAIQGEKYELFGPFLKVIEGADLSVTNLESPAIDKGSPQLKTGPNLKTPVRTLKVLADSGFNLLTLANNHIMDYGAEGLNSTIQESQKLGLNTVGAGMSSQEAEKPYIKDIHGLAIGVLNIAENEFGATCNSNPGFYGMNPVKNYYSIEDLSKETDFLILIVHGGHENYPLPSPAMKERYRFFIDAGADLVVGHHPHCFSGFEFYRGAQIHYSLGNFLFDGAKNDYDLWSRGYMLQLDLGKDGNKITPIPYIQNGNKAGLRKLTKIEMQNFNEEFGKLSKIISHDKKLGESFDKFCMTKYNLYSSYIESHSIKSLHFLQNRNLFPSFINERKKRLLLNLTRCESHRDVLMNILKS
ncbi:CapA family protein [Rhodohalobacter sp.]|uniref:CapA family protein n=1 Tax=Rhodohalobacter sp. TaxID=1974210 RepID=UPI002ACDC276|nr:CapA family protein [Rhodohalobacter sp.]MDZ7755190.1 CapA family protein [Rhodohalobacter sp.]